MLRREWVTTPFLVINYLMMDYFETSQLATSTATRPWWNSWAPSWSRRPASSSRWQRERATKTQRENDWRVKFPQVWETALLPRQVLDKLEMKGFKVGSINFAQFTIYYIYCICNSNWFAFLMFFLCVIFLQPTKMNVTRGNLPRSSRPLALDKLLRWPFIKL